MSAEAIAAGVEIRWTTATENETVGFRVLREMANVPEGREKSLTVVAPTVAVTVPEPGVAPATTSKSTLIAPAGAVTLAGALASTPPSTPSVIS